MYATERFFLVENAGGVVLSAHRTRDEANQSADEVNGDFPAEEATVVERWYMEANSDEREAIESLMS